MFDSRVPRQKNRGCFLFAKRNPYPTECPFFTALRSVQTIAQSAVATKDRPMFPKALETPTAVSEHFLALDHLAIAVADLESSIAWYRDFLGFTLTERRETKGKKTGMLSAVMEAPGLTVVLLEGTTPDSQVTRFLENFGHGVQHYAIQVKNLEELVPTLEKSGVALETRLIESPGLKQVFLKRNPQSGVMIELIERLDEEATFSDIGVQQLFDQLEANDAY